MLQWRTRGTSWVGPLLPPGKDAFYSQSQGHKTFVFRSRVPLTRSLDLHLFVFGQGILHVQILPFFSRMQTVTFTHRVYDFLCLERNNPDCVPALHCHWWANGWTKMLNEKMPRVGSWSAFLSKHWIHAWAFVRVWILCKQSAVRRVNCCDPGVTSHTMRRSTRSTLQR